MRIIPKRGTTKVEDKVKVASYVVKSMIKKYAANKGKRMAPSFIAWLNRKLIMIMDQQIHALGPVVKTLNGHDAEAVDNIRR